MNILYERNNWVSAYIRENYPPNFQPIQDQSYIGYYPEAILSKYEIGPLIGQGGYGKVCRARDKGTGNLVAIKVRFIL
jgi:serine/threonine protein kinase